MGSFMESPRFPESISYGVQFGPEFVTTISSNAAGMENRNRVRARALCKGDCSHALKKQSELTTLITFFRSVGGRFTGFRFKDWADFQLDFAQSSLTLVTLTTNQFQINKLYQSAVGFSELRIIKKPVVGTLVLKDLGVVVNPGIAAGEWTLEPTTGVITIGAGLTRLAANLTVSCEFDVPARFDTDSMPVRLDMWQAGGWDQIPIVELRNP